MFKKISILLILLSITFGYSQQPDPQEIYAPLWIKYYPLVSAPDSIATINNGIIGHTPKSFFDQTISLVGNNLSISDGNTIDLSGIAGTGDLLSTNNLDDLDNVSTARDNLGLGLLAVLDSVSGTEIKQGTITNQDIAEATITVSKINGQGTIGQVLTTDGSGTSTWEDPTGNTYTAGTGLNLIGTEFSVDNTVINPDWDNVINKPVNLDLDSTDDFSGVFSDLTSIPAGLSDGDDDTTYIAGTGLELLASVFSIDTEIIPIIHPDSPEKSIKFAFFRHCFLFLF